MKKYFAWIGAVLLALVAGLAYGSGFLALTSAPWTPSRKKDLQRIVSALQVRPGQVIYDLGCGDGRLCVELARATKARVVGVELSLAYYCLARLRVRWAGMGRQVKIEWGSFYQKNLREADRVFFYLTQKTASSLASKLKHELKKGARVVAYRYPIARWQPTEHYPTHTRQNEAPIYVYDPSHAQNRIFYHAT